jgi:hypothetical protein
MPHLNPLISSEDIRKKIAIDDIQSFENFEYFKQWNYVKKT